MSLLYMLIPERMDPGRDGNINVNFYFHHSLKKFLKRIDTKKVKNTHGGVLLLVKLQAKAKLHKASHKHRGGSFRVLLRF